MIFADENNENHLQQQTQCRLNKSGHETIRNALQELSVKVDVDIDQLQPSLLKIFEALIFDREYWRKEALSHSQELSRMHCSNSLLEKERDQLNSSIESLKRDLTGANARSSSLINEQRELRNHWLAEKADLQSRFCQVQSLNTQIQGSLKKKEKEFDKLQTQLTKLVKDSSRGSKSTILISLALKKPTSQESNNSNNSCGALLRDAEVVALKRSLQQFQHENSMMQNHLHAIKTSLSDLQSAFESKLREMEEKHKIELDIAASERGGSAVANDGGGQFVSTKMIKNIQNLAEYRIPQTPQADKVDSLVLLEVKSLKKSSVCKTPGTIARKYLEGTPGVRPMNVIIQQTNTEIKNLRSCVDDIANNSRESFVAYEKNSSELQDAVAKIMNLRARLAEAMIVIEEQDRLIHETLVGKLPLTDNQNSLEWDVDLDEDDVFEIGNIKNNNEMAKLANDYTLPPASPETMALLKSYGWSVPRVADTLESKGIAAEQLEFDD